MVKLQLIFFRHVEILSLILFLTFYHSSGDTNGLHGVTFRRQYLIAKLDDNFSYIFFNKTNLPCA